MTLSLRTTIMTGGAVLTLWAVSFALSFVPLGGAALPVALAIALAKAVLVALVFMELAKEALQVKLTVLVAVFLVLLLGGLMIADILTRA